MSYQFVAVNQFVAVAVLFIDHKFSMANHKAQY